MDSPEAMSPAPDQPQPLRSVHTSNLPEIFNQLGISVLVSTYQSGHLVMLRPDGDVLNTHFRIFDKPMGMAVDSNRLAIGTAMEVIEFHNLPSVAARLDPPNVNDSVFLPRVSNWTGDIQIHEMAWVNSTAENGNEKAGSPDELVFINTLFSCLCCRSDTFSFEPIWRPSFITKYVPGDCCHVNGLATQDGVIKYVTALGETDAPGGWRENKKDGGLLVDVEANEIVMRGLSMPHSPRWYDGRWWLLESGTGTFGTMDPENGTYTPIVELPGFTRGLSFCGPLAFIGLSQVRETAVFGGIPIAEKALEERACGVWVVNINTGEIVGFVKFEDAVQEIFAVEVLHSSRFPDLINHDKEIVGSSYELPDFALVDVPDELK
jgi:uncharacterized protein (TIGR03032 family)